MTESRYLVLVLLAFCIPLGLGANLLYPVTIGLLAPLIFRQMCTLKPWQMLFLMSFLVPFLAQLFFRSGSVEWFQVGRGFLPFVCFLVLLVSYRELVSMFSAFIGGVDYIRLQWLLIVLYLAQMISLFLGLRVANATFSTDSFETIGQGRFYLFPMSAIFVALLFGVAFRNVIVVIVSIFILWATGSKVYLVASTAAFLISVLVFPGRIGGKVGMLGLILLQFIAVGLVFPSAFDRLYEYALSGELVDETRSSQFVQAFDMSMTNAVDWLFGRGFGHPVSWGHLSLDPRWEMNSKFDIENEFYNLLLKTGIVGSLTFWVYFVALGFGNRLRAPFFLALLVISTGWRTVSAMDWALGLVHLAALEAFLSTRNGSPGSAVSASLEGPSSFRVERDRQNDQRVELGRGKP